MVTLIFRGGVSSNKIARHSNFKKLASMLTFSIYKDQSFHKFLYDRGATQMSYLGSV